MKDLARFSGERLEARSKVQLEAAPKHRTELKVPRNTETAAPQAASQVQQLTISDEDAGQRIDNFLLRICKGVPKSHIYRVLRNGQVRVNKGRIDQTYRLVENDIVRVPPIRVADKVIHAVPGAEF